MVADVVDVVVICVCDGARDGDGDAAGDAVPPMRGDAPGVTDGDGCALADGDAFPGGELVDALADGDDCAEGVAPGGAAVTARGATAASIAIADAMTKAASGRGEAPVGDFVGAVSGGAQMAGEQRATRLMLRGIHGSAHSICGFTAAFAAGSSHALRHVALCAVASSVLLTVACGSAATTTATPPRATSPPTAQPIATAPPPPSFPLPTGNAPVPTASAASPVTYAVPPGYGITIATDQEVELDSTQGSERLVFVVDPSIEDVSHAIGQLTVGGETGYVLARGATQDGLYKEVVIVRHHGAQYELSCTGFRGYDSSRLTAGCDTFTRSIAFTS